MNKNLQKPYKGGYNKNIQKPAKEDTINFYKSHTKEDTNLLYLPLYGFCVDMPEDDPGTSRDM